MKHSNHEVNVDVNSQSKGNINSKNKVDINSKNKVDINSQNQATIIVQNKSDSNSHEKAKGNQKRRVIMIVLIVIAAVILIPLIVLLILSPGKTRKLRDENGKVVKGSISEKRFVMINGIQMGMFIESADLSNPVLLFIHGGPGMPEHFMTEDYETGLWKNFTVVWLDQRGAGLSTGKEIDYSKVTTQVLIDDIIAATNYLKEEFHQEKIYLMAHSWGTYLGILAAKQAPQLYHAYIGVAQMVDQMESEQIAYEYMIDYYKKNDNSGMAKRLKNAGFGSDAYWKLRDSAMHKAGVGTTHAMKSVPKEIFFASLDNPEYTFGEKIRLWYGKIKSSSIPAGDEMNQTDFRETLTSLEIPVYFFSGIYDYTVNYQMVREYERILTAPKKGYYLFVNSAHSPIFEEPDRVNEIMVNDVLQKKNELADQK